MFWFALVHHVLYFPHYVCLCVSVCAVFIKLFTSIADGCGFGFFLVFFFSLMGFEQYGDTQWG